jgi:hypothetical protein
MGVVYFGRQVQLDRPVAIKMIRSGALASDEEVQRFYAEAKNAAKLDHPNIVTVYQCGQVDGHHYFSMDYVDGTDLERLVKQGPLDSKRAAAYVRDAAKAIEFAHRRGVLHRDLKPANVLLDTHDRVRITDFGLAKMVGKENGLTATGAALGTPSYMSPEQAAGRNDQQAEATDVYSLGAILYCTLTGVPPFRSETALQTLLHVIHKPAPLLRTLRREIQQDLETIADKCLQKKPEDRYSSAAALADDLDRFVNGLPIKARRLPVLKRAWQWFLGIPIIGAMLDYRVVEVTDTHRWVQRGMISTGSLLLLAMLLMMIPSSVWYKNRMPKVVRIAGGAEGGQYSVIANKIADALERQSGCQTQWLTTAGSSDNLERLDSQQVHMALMQADMVDKSHLAVVAPLYFEAVHLLVRNDHPGLQLEDLKEQRVFLGQPKGGSRVTAQKLLEYCGVNISELKITEEIFSDPPVDAAILVTRIGASEIVSLLSKGAFRLIEFGQAWEFALSEPAFHPIRITAENYPDHSITQGGIGTVATVAYLVCNRDAPDILVKEVLKCLYSTDVSNIAGILTAEQAAHWQGIAWHPAAQTFFQAYRGSRPRS